MDGKGAWRDNVFVERLWRTVKYEEVYLRNGRMTVADDFVVALVGLRPPDATTKS
ncbi:hypothetical protein AB7M42_007817 [Bradyrhizobium diazoefficiens]|uniref:Transposase n=4 Tax=Bradyrhizobium TaxID=374 RepID=A0A809XLG1_9BRAD|nr:hypothetical protein [Bradyrhizobium japonicum]MCS3933256.1 hypothetical protein [Bradyrhizobium elkanii]BAL13325.1 transposase [Bradyrhizobium japonicum USDA 6]BBO08346.1 hypothetical protein SG09_76960 [Bradyrhizobium ottawaense]BBZ92000.1 hypothetical protein F07S3_18330 [Bradyrhizobium diazoefficiens]